MKFLSLLLSIFCALTINFGINEKITQIHAESYSQKILTNQNSLQDKVSRYLRGERELIESKSGYGFFEDELTIGTEKTLNFTFLDMNGNQINDKVKFYIHTEMPFTRLFNEEETNIEFDPIISSGETYQVSSPIKINKDKKSITARSFEGKVSSDGLHCWIVAIQDEKYGYILPVHIIDKEIIHKKEQVEQVVSKILNDMKNLSDLDKVVYVFEYLVETVTYSYEYLGKPSLYNTLIKRGAVCDGYAVAFKYLMDRSGIVCEKQIGNIKNSTDLHAWNRVMIENEWYYVDATWGDIGDKDGTKNYKYLFTPRSIMDSERELPDNGENIGKKYLYYITSEYDEMFKIKIDQQIKNALDSLKNGINVVNIFLPYNLQDINKTQEYVQEQFNNQSFTTCNYKKPIKIIQYKGIIMEYNIECSKETQSLEAKFKIKDNESSTIIIELDKEINLIIDNIYIQDEIKKPNCLRKISNYKYEVCIDNKDKNEIIIEIKKTGYNVSNINNSITIPPEKELAIPNAKFVGTDLNKGLLSELSQDMEYNLSDGIWRKVTNSSINVMPKNIYDRENSKIKSRILVRRVGNNGKYSKSQEILINRPMNAPDYIKIVDKNGEKVVVNTNSCEYRLKDTVNWISSNGNDIKGLSNGIYEFRIKGKNNNFASESVFLTIEGLNKPEEVLPEKPNENKPQIPEKENNNTIKIILIFVGIFILSTTITTIIFIVKKNKNK